MPIIAETHCCQLNCGARDSVKVKVNWAGLNVYIGLAFYIHGVPKDIKNIPLNNIRPRGLL